MQTKELVFKICLVLGAMLLFMANPVDSKAGSVRCEVSIDLVGSTDSNSTTSGHVFSAHKVGGDCPGWGTRVTNNFLVTTINGDGMLATILTASSLGKTLFIHSLDDTFGNWATIHQVYLAP